MRAPWTPLALAGSLTLLVACSAPSLTPMGRGVIAMGAPPGGPCQPLGPVTGEGRGMFSSGSLIEYATNDARNQAADLGATHVHTMPPTLIYSASQQSAGVSGATVTGTAYRCASPPPRPERGIYAALGPAPAWPTGGVSTASATPEAAPVAASMVPPPLMVAEEAPPATNPAPTEVAVRMAIDARRREILTCVGREMAAVDGAYTAAGDVTVSLTGDLAGSAAEGCVRSALGALHLDHVSGAGAVRHLVR